MGSHQPSVDFVGQSSPPPYEQATKSPLLLAETTTTRTEVVTTTTTETTTHLFSLPHWKKRVPSRNYNVQLTNSPSNSILFNKALPPTPSDDTISSGLPPSSSPPTSNTGLPAVHNSAAALVHATLGLGLPHASIPISPSPHPTSVSLMSPRSPGTNSFAMRRTKSSGRIQAIQVPGNHGPITQKEVAPERRRRGLSFTASSILGLTSPSSDVKGKAKQTDCDMVNIAHPSLKPLSRRSSFWTKKRAAQPNDLGEPSPPQDEDVILTLPPLPPIHRVSPFDIGDLSSTPHLLSQTNPRHPKVTSRSQSDCADVYNSPTSSTNDTLPYISFPRTPPHSALPSRISHEMPPTPSVSPRPRAQTNPPLLHRLSIAVFSSLDSSHSFPRSSSSILSPRAPTPPCQPTIPPPVPIPKPLVEEESPELYLTRLKSAVSKAEVAGILASSPDAFYVRTLRAYISQFDFVNIPLDIALRKLLMEVGLPRETQQIDRVVEAFASRYVECNPDYFISDDHPYILAFSLIMLHTDAFNRSNKRKMTKPDYVKNTKLPGIPIEVLDCFYDNIVFAPFIFIEDPVDVNGQPGLTADVTHPLATQDPSTALSTAKETATFKLGTKVDPYYLITNNLLGPLHIDVESYIPLENPFTYEGTAGPWDEKELHHAFIGANIIEIDTRAIRRPSAFFSGGAPVAASVPELSLSSKIKKDLWGLKLTKVGLLNRKDDTMEGGKRASNRKWRTYSVIMTGSQLLLFRDPTWVSTLLTPPETQGDCPLPPPASFLRPDELFSVKDAVAVYDKSYVKYQHTFRFILCNGRQLLFQASDDRDLNEWLSRINYGSAFKSVGVRMRPLGLSGNDVHLTGVAAATSHLHDMHKQIHAPRTHSWGSDAPHDLMEMLSGPPVDKPTLKRKITMIKGRTEVDLEASGAPEIDGAEQFKATFDQVKADLAASSWKSPSDELWLHPKEDSDCIQDSPPTSPTSVNGQSSRLPSRSHIIQSKIHDLDSKVATLESQLDSDIRYVRNLAILTPFRKATRSQLQSAAQGMARRITQVRLELQKLTCHRTVLYKDMQFEGQMWHHSRKIALRAAQETLQSRCIPKMTLSHYNDNGNSQTDSGEYPVLPYPPSPGRPESSLCDSFHSATDSGFDWPLSEDLVFLAADRRQESPRPSLAASAGSSTSITCHSSIFATPDRQRHSSSGSGGHTPSTEPTTMHAQSDHLSEDEEEAEEWNQTRCAKRVSLIQVPSNINLSAKLRNRR